MRTWHVSTFCTILPEEINRDMVMETIEIVMVINQVEPPHPTVIAGLIKMIAPNVEPLLSEIILVPTVEHFNRR